MLIRNARAEHLATLLQFEQGVIGAKRPFDPTLREGLIHYYDLEKMLADENVAIVVAELDQQVIASGYARIKEAKPFEQHERYAYLGFMFVHPGHRGQGINAAIIDALKQWALSKHITEMRLEVYTANLPAVKAYKKYGFSEHLVQMRIDISQL